MPTTNVNGLRLFCEVAGSGAPLVLVHGSWVSHHDWDLVVPALAERFRVAAYDRRGHSASEGPAGQGSVREDVADLAGLIEALDLAPAWVAANSFGGSIALRLAAERPEMLRGVIAHDPPLFALLAGDPSMAPMLDEAGRRIGAVVKRIAAGDHAGAAEAFVETVALGPGSWAGLQAEARATLIGNAPTFLDEGRDPEQLGIDVGRLAGFTGPALLTTGDRSPPSFAPVVAKLAAALPTAEVQTFAEAGHIPHLTHPEAYVATTIDFVGRHST